MEKGFRQSPDQLEEFLELIGEDLGNVERVIEFCEENDIDAEFVVHSKSETAEESSENTGFDLEQIVKNLVFRTGEEFTAVLCPGSERVSESSLEEITGKEVRMASPEEVKQNTGYVVGGVSPFDLDIPVIMEESLMNHEKIKPAAGSRVVGVEISPEELRELRYITLEEVVG